MNGTLAFANGRTAHGATIGATLLAPWRSTRRQNAWLTLAVLVCGCALALGFGCLMPTPHGQTIAMVWYGTAVAFMWAFCLSNLVLVARDAHRMALPGVPRNTTTSALTYAALTVAVPVAVEAAFGWNALMPALVAALAAALGLAFVLLPRWLSMWMGFVPAIYASLHDTHHIGSLRDPGFVAWGGPLLLVVLLAAVMRWRALLRGGSDEVGGWNTPMILQLRKQAVSADWGFDRRWSWRPGHQHRHVDLHGIGSATPVKTIEVALGSLYLPQTAQGRLRRLGTVLLPVLLFAALMLVMNLGNLHSWRKLALVTAISGGMWAGMFGISMLLLALYAVLRRRWNQGAEPALLALLPGLDRTAPLHRSVTRAAFAKPLLACLALWMLMVACELLARIGWSGLVLTTVVVVGLCTTAALAILRLLAARPLRRWVPGVLTVSLFGLTCLSFAVAFVVPLAKLGPRALLVQWGVIAAWVVYGGWMLVLVARAWRMLRARPHPFLGGAR